MSKPLRPKTVINISSLRQDDNVAKAYSEFLDADLNIDDIPSDIDLLSERIGDVILDSLDKACPKMVKAKDSYPWENAELQSMMADLRKSAQNSNLRKQIREKAQISERSVLSREGYINQQRC